MGEEDVLTGTKVWESFKEEMVNMLNAAEWSGKKHNQFSSKWSMTLAKVVSKDW